MAQVSQSRFQVESLDLCGKIVLWRHRCEYTLFSAHDLVSLLPSPKSLL